jgi:putative peptidoglycan lipid II flippase
MMNFFKSSQHSISSAAMLLMAAAFASRLLGLLRDRILAAQFGAGEELDIYFAAFRIPDLLYNILIAGAITVAFIPVFIEVRKRNTQEAWAVAQNFFNIMALVLATAAFISFLCMPWLVRAIAPGFSGEKYELTLLLSRIMLLSPVLLGLSAVLSGVTQAFQKFLPYALAPLLYNLGIIVGVVFFVPVFGFTGLAWGVVVGAIAHMLLNVFWAYASGFRLSTLFAPRKFAFFHILKLMAPRSLGLVAWQMNILVMTSLASLLAAGSVAVFHLANNLQYLVIGIVGISYATVSLPAFSHSYESGTEDRSGYVANIVHTLRQILFLALPLSALLFVLRAQLVRVVLGTGVFSWEDTRLTAAVLGIFCFGIFAHSIIPTLARAFYAAQNTWAPVVANIMGVVINIVLSIALSFFFLQDGIAPMVGNMLHISDLANIPLMGLPISFVISGIITLMVLVKMFFTGYCPPDARPRLQKELAQSFLRILVLSFLAGFVAYATLRVMLVIPMMATDTFWGIFVQGLGAAIVGLSVYLGGMIAFQLPERSFVHALFSFLKIDERVFSRRKNSSQE